jgi:hypothetical protein
MDEKVAPAFPLNESETLCIVEPLNFTLWHIELLLIAALVEPLNGWRHCRNSSGPAGCLRQKKPHISVDRIVRLV